MKARKASCQRRKVRRNTEKDWTDQTDTMSVAWNGTEGDGAGYSAGVSDFNIYYDVCPFCPLSPFRPGASLTLGLRSPATWPGSWSAPPSFSS